MKILVLTHEFPPVGGGGGHVAKDLCEGLSTLGHQIKIITADLMGGVSEESDLTEQKFSLIRIPSLRRDLARASMPAMISFIISSVIKGFFLIRKWKPDLIHVHFAVPSGPIAWILSRLTGVPYLITIHLGDIPGGTPKKTDQWFKFIQPLTYPVWRRAERIIAVSSFSRQLAIKHYQVPIDVIHNGVDLSLYQSGEITVNHPPKIVFAGRFVPQKNPLNIIRTLAELKDLEWELVMMGDGELFEQVKDEVLLNGLGERVKLPGWVTPEEVKREFQRSDILFMPSLSEGLPVVGVQALASGLAIIVSDIGGFSDLVIPGENGYLCDPKNIESFLTPLEELLGDPNRLLEFRQTSLKKAKDFDLARIVKMYEDELRIVAEDGSF
jgi:glycosyltransferase involved in cell wall biosynthesis